MITEQTPVSLLPTEVCADIDRWIAKYPADQKQSAVMQALMIVQQHNGGYLTEPLMDAVADYLEMDRIGVYEVATFYSMYDLKPVGKHKINVCTNISCKLCGAKQIVHHLEKSLHIQLGQTTDDGRFTLRGVECLGACVNAPMMQIDDVYYENLTPEKVNNILAEIED